MSPTFLRAGLLLAALHSTPVCSAATAAYWRFEGDGITTPVAGQQVTDTDGHTAIDNTEGGLVAIDTSGNGNHLYAWDHSFAGFTYQPAVSSSVIPQTGASNGFSVQNAGSFPAMSTNNSSLESAQFATWTIEASIRLSAIDNGFHTFVGRDGNGVASSDANLAPLYFQTTNDERISIKYADAAGNFWVAESAADFVQANAWYSVAATNNGSLLSLYVNSGSGYQLIASTDLSASANSTMAAPQNYSNAGGETMDWTLGRGRYGTADGFGDNHGDRFFGNIDEVRISDVALDPSQFLMVPEPSTSLLLGLCGLLAIGRRRR